MLLDNFIWSAENSATLKSFRWPATAVYALAVLTMSCISFSWQQFSLLLMTAGAFEWLCSPEEIADHIQFEGAACLAQEKATGDLFSILTTTQALSGLLGGVAIDHFGRRWCAGVGCAVAGVSIVLLVVAGPNFRSGYTIATVLDGLSCNMVAFPALVLADIFPRHPVAATAFVLTSEFLGAIVTPILWALWKGHPEWSISTIWIVYLLAVMLPLSVLYVLTLPPTSYAKRIADEELERIKLRQQQQNENPEVPTTVPSLVSREDDEEATPPSIALLEKKSSFSIDAHRRTLVVLNDTSAKTETTSIEKMTTEEKVPFKAKMLSLWMDLYSMDFLCFEIVFNLFMIKHTYYPATLREMSGLEVSNFQGIFQTSQCVWALLLGAVADFCSTSTAALGLSLGDALILLLSIVPSQPLQYGVAVIFTALHSYVYTIRFTFCRETFNPQNRGKILGVIGCGSAITTLLNIPINRTTRYRMWCLILTGFCVIQWPFIYILRRRYKRLHRFRAPPKPIRLCGRRNRSS